MRKVLKQIRRRKHHTVTSEASETFFQEQLRGEVGLSRATAEELYVEATAFMMEKPWEYVADTELILVDDAESGERCYCCVMGAVGAWVGMYVYQGAEGYRMYQKVASEDSPDPYSFYEKQRGVSLEIVKQEDLEAADRQVLKALGHPQKRGFLAPQFRAVRPGYLPWYVTESEARLLRRCLQTVNDFCAEATDEDLDQFWQAEDVYPLVIPKKKENTVSLVKVPVPGPAQMELPDLDEERVRRVAAECKKSEMILETEHFFAPGTIGKVKERKACLQLSIVADAKTGFLYQSELGVPGESHSAVVSRALLACMESAHMVPAEVRVKEAGLETGLAGLGAALGFKVRTVKSLPTTQEARKFLFERISKQDRIF